MTITRKILLSFFALLLSGVAILIPSPSRAVDSWYNSDWIHRKSLIINKAKLSGTVTNFPMLVSLSSDAQLAADAQDDGDDILFTNAAGTKLDAQLEFFDGDTGQLICWVEVDSISSSDNTTIYMYYNHGDASSQWNATGTWNSSYKAVWHNSDNTTSTIPDSTASGASMTKHAANEPVVETGKIYKSQHFDGSNDHANVVDTDLNMGSAYTLEGWFKPAQQSLPDYVFAFANRDSDSYYSILIKSNSVSPYARSLTTISRPAGTNTEIDSLVDLSIDEWSYVTLCYTGGATDKVYFYVNGEFAKDGATGSTDMSVSSGNAAQGDFSDQAAYYYHGSIDEFRIANINVGADWAKASYNSQNSPSTFYLLGEEISQTYLSVSAESATFVTLNSAIIRGSEIITSENVTSRGFAWSTTDNATTPGLGESPPASYSDNWTESGNWGSGSFSHAISSLSENTTYYYRSYAYTSTGWTWSSSIVSFPTTIASTTTSSATSVEDTSSTLNGSTTIGGGMNIVSRGFAWSTTDNATTPGLGESPPASYSDNWTESGNWGTGAFTYAKTGLSAGTTYYYRSYSRDDNGWTWSSQHPSFLTKPAAPTNVAATENSSSKVTISWTKMTGATDYHVYRGSTDLGLSGDVSYYDDQTAASPQLSLSGNTTMRESFSSGTNGDSTFGSPTEIRGMTFTTTDSYVLTKVEMYLKKDTSSPLSDATLSLRATDANHKPTGSVLSQCSIPYTSVGTSWGWVSFIIPPIALQSNTQYHIGMSSAGTGYSYYLSYYSPSGYAGGDLTNSSNGGSKWTIFSGYAGKFRTYSSYIDGLFSSIASDGTNSEYVNLSLDNTPIANNGVSYLYKVIAQNSTGHSVDSSTDAGYRLATSLSYQWNRSAGDSDASYSVLSGATSSTYQDTGAPIDGSGRYYTCTITSSGSLGSPLTFLSNRGYRLRNPSSVVSTMSETDGIWWSDYVVVADSNYGDRASLTSLYVNGLIVSGSENVTSRGFAWSTTDNATTPGLGESPPASYSDNWTESGNWGSGFYSRTISGLSENTTYFYRSYVKDSTGYIWSTEQPSLTTGKLYVTTESMLPTSNNTGYGPDSVTIATIYGEASSIFTPAYCLDGSFRGGQNSMIRYKNLIIPSGSHITSSHLVMNHLYSEDNFQEMTLIVAAENVSNSLWYAFDITEGDWLLGDTGDISSRFSNWTTSVVEDWTVPWSAGVHTSTDISSLIQEIIDKESWESGNDISFIIMSGEGTLYFDFIDLIIEFEEPALLGVENIPTGKSFGSVAENSIYYAHGDSPSNPVISSDCRFTVSNVGSAAVDIQIQAINFTGGAGWTLSPTVGVDNVTLTAYPVGINPSNGVIVSTSPQSFITNLAASSNISWDFSLQTGTFTNGVEKVGKITLTAVEH